MDKDYARRNSSSELNIPLTCIIVYQCSETNVMQQCHSHPGTAN
jgi:hypothetical protein